MKNFDEFLQKSSWKNVVIFVVAIATVMATLHYLFSLLEFGRDTLQPLIRRNLMSAISSPYFWESSIGVAIRAMIEIVVASIMLKIGTILIQVPIPIKRIILVTSFCSILFVIQLTAEVIYINLFMSQQEMMDVENFSLFSLSFFLQKFHINTPPYLRYMFEEINLFEITFWLLIGYSISKVASVSYKKAFSVVGFYIFMLFIWLLLIAILCLSL